MLLKNGLCCELRGFSCKVCMRLAPISFKIKYLLVLFASSFCMSVMDAASEQLVKPARLAVLAQGTVGRTPVASVEEACRLALSGNWTGEITGQFGTGCLCYSNPGDVCAAAILECPGISWVRDERNPWRCIFNPEGPMSNPENIGEGGCPKIGNPIQILGANKFEKEAVYTSKSNSAFPIRFNRYYNSSKGWTHNYWGYIDVVRPTDRFGLPLGNSKMLYIYKGDGQELKIYKSDSGEWQVKSGIIVSEVDGSYLLHYPGGVIEKYDNFYGDARLVSIEYLGIGHTIRYDSKGRTVSIEHSNGEKIEIGYSSDQTFIPGSLYYHDPVTNSNLLQATFSNVNELTQETILVAGGQEFKRVYEYSLGGLLLRMSNDEGVFAEWGYDERHRPVISQHADGREKFLVNYSEMNSSSDPRVAVTNPLGKNTVFRFAEIAGVRYLTNVEGRASDNCAAANKEYTYYPNGTLQSKTDWSGNITTYVRDSFGRETSRTEASGTPAARTISTEYHPTLNQPVKITAPGLITEMTYDAAGRLLNTKKTAAAAP